MPDALSDLPTFTGGKILIYPHIDMDLTAIADFGELGRHDPRFDRLARLCAERDDIWNHAAEDYVLQAFTAEART